MGISKFMTDVLAQYYRGEVCDKRPYSILYGEEFYDRRPCSILYFKRHASAN